MKPLATIGALVTIAVALFVVSKLTAPTTDVPTTPPPPPAKPADEPAKPDGEKLPNVEKTEVEKPDAETPADPTDLNYQQNPFDLKRAKPWPKAVIDPVRFEFGSMPLGSTRSHTFVVKNEGEAPLKLEKGPLQCKCTMPALKNKAIPPGESAEIVLEWKPLAVQAGFEKEAIIWTDDPENARIGLQIFGDVVSDDAWEPSDSFRAEHLRQGEERTMTGLIYSKTRDDLKIEKVDQIHNSVKVEYQPADEETLKAKEAKCGYVFKVTIPPSDNIALIRETITVTVNSATNTQIVWQVVGSRVGPINI
ncbi:MAG TPA: DUF1573 domain-containing protein, partial [Caulifigura sp.]|nr:DUF1573 domain-containing protein [Caulifigura sp.]